MTERLGPSLTEEDAMRAYEASPPMAKIAATFRCLAVMGAVGQANLNHFLDVEEAISERGPLPWDVYRHFSATASGILVKKHRATGGRRRLVVLSKDAAGGGGDDRADEGDHDLEMDRQEAGVE